MTAPEREALRNALKLARLHIADTSLEHAVISLDQPTVGLGGYLDAVLAETDASPAVTVTEEMISDLRRTQQLAELALESCRYDRLKAGHGDIGGKRGTDIGLWDEEVNQRDRSRAYIKALEAALKSTTPQTGSQE